MTDHPEARGGAQGQPSAVTAPCHPTPANLPQRSTVVLINKTAEPSASAVADLTDRNATVFYETAIARLTKDPHQVVLLAQSDDDVPFDLRPRRYLRYSNNRGGRKTLEAALAGFMAEGLSGEERASQSYHELQAGGQLEETPLSYGNTTPRTRNSK